MIQEEYDHKPSSVIIFKDSDMLNITVNCNITPRTREVNVNDRESFYMCCYTADSNSFRVAYKDIDLNDLITHPEKYLDY